MKARAGSFRSQKPLRGADVQKLFGQDRLSDLGSRHQELPPDGSARRPPLQRATTANRMSLLVVVTTSRNLRYRTAGGPSGRDSSAARITLVDAELLHSSAMNGEY